LDFRLMLISVSFPCGGITPFLKVADLPGPQIRL
jgi:hypothetical protein